MSNKLRLFDEKSALHDNYLSTNASLNLRQSNLDGGGTVSGQNFVQQIAMLGDNFSHDILDSLFAKMKIMIGEMFTPDQWGIDLVKSMPFYDINVDMFGRSWSPTVAPDGFLLGSEMGKVPLLALFILGFASKLPSMSKSLLGVTSAGLAYKKTMKAKNFLNEMDEKIDLLIDQTNGSTAATTAAINRDIAYAEELLTLTSAGLATNHNKYRTDIINKLKDKGSI